jgi:hypothetical protein
MKWLFRNQLGRISYSPTEFSIARFGFALVLVHSIWSLAKANDETSLDEPHGLAWLGNGPEGELSWLGDLTVWFSAGPGVPTAWFLVFAVLLAFYLINFAPIFTSFGLLTIHTLAGTFYMSQGAMHHTQQIISLVLFGQLLASIWNAIKLRRSDSLLWPSSQVFRDSSMFLCQQMIAASYVITGLTKFEKSKGHWIEDSPNLVVQFDKNLQMDFYNHLQPPDERMTQWMTNFLTNYPSLGMIIFGSALLLEFLAFFALFNRSIMALWGLALIAMHLSISVIMKLDFFYNEMVLLIFFVNIPFWIRAAGCRFLKTA